MKWYSCTPYEATLIRLQSCKLSLVEGTLVAREEVPINQLLINCGHPLSEVAAAELEARIGAYDTVVVRLQLDVDASLAEQVTAAIDDAGLSSEDWQTRGIVLNLPGMSGATALVLAEVNGRSGAFPRVLHLVRGEDGVFHLGEILDLARVRNTARQTR